MKKLDQLEGLIKVDGEIVMGEVEVRLQPLKNFEAVREPAKTEEQKLYRTENGVIKDIETQVKHLKTDLEISEGYENIFFHFPACWQAVDF